MSFIVFEICKGVRSELAIFSRKEKAREVVDLLHSRFSNGLVPISYEITDLWGELLFNSATGISVPQLADSSAPTARLSEHRKPRSQAKSE